MTGIKRNSTGTKIHNGCDTERENKNKTRKKPYLVDSEFM